MADTHGAWFILYLQWQIPRRRLRGSLNPGRVESGQTGLHLLRSSHLHLKENVQYIGDEVVSGGECMVGASDWRGIPIKQLPNLRGGRFPV